MFGEYPFDVRVSFMLNRYVILKTVNAELNSNIMTKKRERK